MILFDPKDPKWLHGKRCETHPYLSGLRFAATGNCVHCEDPLEIIPCDMTRVHHSSHASPGVFNPKTQYLGEVCTKHPELKGKRFRCNNKCLGCNRDDSAKIRERKREAAKARAKALGMTYRGRK